MALNPRVMFVVGATPESAKKYADLIRFCGFEDLDIRALSPQKGLSGFVEGIKRIPSYKPYALLTADVFSNCEPVPPLNIVLRTLSADKTLGLRIFVVRAHGMVNINPNALIEAGAHGVYNGAGINNKDFKDWFRRIRDKSSTSIHEEQAVKRSRNAEESRLIGRILNGTTGEEDERHPTPKVTPNPIPSLKPQPKSEPPSPLSLNLNNTNEEEDSHADGGSNSNEGTQTIQPIEKESSVIPPKIETEHMAILLRALADASIAFGTSINRQLQGEVQEAGKLEATGGTPAETDQRPPGQPDGGSTSKAVESDILLEKIDGYTISVRYRDHRKFELPKGKAELLKLLIDANGEIVSYEEIASRFALKNHSTVAQKLSNMFTELKKKAPKLADCISNKQGKGYIFNPPPK